MKLRRKNKYAVGQIIGAGIQLGDMIGKPIKERADRFDPNTGELINPNASANAATAGGFFDPLRTGLETMREGSLEEKQQYWKSFGQSLLGVPFLAGKGFGKARADRLEKQRKEQIWNMRNPSVQGTSYNPYYMAGGGISGEYAELEDGEPFMTPDGNIEMVNGRTHAEGGEDYVLPTGTAILGKNVSKRYGERFKELGAKLKKAQDKHQKNMTNNANPIARRTSMLMLDRIEKQYADLVQEQELAKRGQHIMPDGTIMNNDDMYKKGGIINKNKYQKGEDIGGYNPYFDPYNLELKRPNNFGLDTQYKINAIPYPTVNTSANRINSPSPYIPEVQGAEPQLDWSGLRETSRMSPIQPRGGVFSPVDLKTAAGGVGEVEPRTPDFNRSFNINNLGNTLTTLGQLAPIAYNLGQGLFGKPDVYDYRQYTNPYIGNIRSLMRNRRYNVQPELEANKIAQSVYNRNLSQAGASPSQLYAGLQAGTVGRQRADAAALANQQNVNNQYIGQQAEMDYNLGRDISGLKQYGYEANLRNRAALRNYLSTGLSQVQQYAQVQELMKNQKLRDKERLALLKDILPNYLYKEYEGYLFNHNNN